MTEHVASRTLVKSPPELWAECSDATSLARHLDQFGEIRITRLEPETAVAWEGERARGTVRFEPSGWGTKVILTAVAAEEELVPAEPEPSEEPEPPEPEPPLAAEAAEEPDPNPVPPVVAEAVEEPDPDSVPPVVAEAVEEPDPDSVPPVVADAADDPDSDPEPDPMGVAEQVEAIELNMDGPARRRRFSRLFGFFRAPPREPVLLVEPGTVQEPTREPEPAAEAEPQPEPWPAPETERLPEPEVITEPELQAEPEPAPEPQSVAPEAPAGTEMPATEAALTAALESLGQAHHRPYSRA